MQWTGLNELREKYLSFFESKGHLRLDSFPLVPKNDPSLLLINSGMAPMKKWFLAQEEPPRHRVTTCQKCIRTPDIERVGITARHGTFFEMLGNFSFQDYFKEEVIPWAWEFLTSDEWMAIPKDKLHISVYEEDDEAYDIWTKKVGIAPDHMVRLGKEDNFWEHGSGPCGPCSEIYFDRGPEYGCGKPTCGVGCDCDRYMEIWNLVFSQFDADGKGHYERLARPNIDTGMGLERLASVLQQVDTNYDIDLFQNLMRAAKQAVEEAGAENVDPQSPSLKVIADHIRSCGFAVADGVKPGNEGRAYVIRRICRRAIRHGYKLGARGPFFYKLIEPLAREMGDIYPEIKNPKIAEVIRAEEERFLQTLSNGMQILDEAMVECKDGVLPGDIAFKLHDTYGFPVDLTGDVCRERGLTVDTEGFEACMLEQKNKARAAGKFKIAADVLFTGDNNEFVGYDTLEVPQAKVLAVYKDGIQVEAAQAGDDVLVILDKTPFYAEMGGQVGDTGVLENGTTLLQVRDCLKLKASVFSHVAHVCEGEVKTGDTFNAVVDAKRREAIMRNHSVTHIMHKALREVLGEHVAQKGSLVNDAVTRFDFHHDKPMTAEEIRQVEDIVNAEILANTPVQCRVMSLADARTSGATMLFGEKYGETVRVLNIGTSVELCGGTHVARTGDIGSFKIISEAGISAGVRRVEAVTGLNAVRLMQDNADLLATAAAKFKAPAQELPEKIDHLGETVKRLEKELAEAKAKLAAKQGDEALSAAQDVNGVKVLLTTLEGIDAKTLRETMDKFKSKFGSAVIVLAVTGGDKAQLCAGVTKDLIGKIKAGELVNFVAAQCGGKGGGKPDMAMAGASDVKALPAALESARAWIAEKLA